MSRSSKISKSSRRITRGSSDDDFSDEELLELEPEDNSVIRIGVIANTEITLGFLLAGIGYHRDGFRNYLAVQESTALAEIEDYFHTLYKYHNIGVILIDYPTAKRLNHILDQCKSLLPVVVIVPTKSTIGPYLEEREKLRRQRQRDAYT